MGQAGGKQCQQCENDGAHDAFTPLINNACVRYEAAALTPALNFLA
jgi:hypothetical protein